MVTTQTEFILCVGTAVSKKSGPWSGMASRGGGFETKVKGQVGEGEKQLRKDNTGTCLGLPGGVNYKGAEEKCGRTSSKALPFRLSPQVYFFPVFGCWTAGR